MADVSSSVVRIGNPAKAYNAGWTYACNVWDLQAYDDKIFVGAGNSANTGTDANAGAHPVFVLTPPSTFASEGVSGTLSTEQTDNFRVIGADLIVPSHDPTGTSALIFYRRSAGTWTEVSEANSVGHVFDVYEFGGEWFAACRKVGASSGLWKSTDSGASWTACTDPGAETHWLFELDGTLYTSADASSTGNWIFAYAGSGTTFSAVSGTTRAAMFPSDTTNSRRVHRPTNFLTSLMYIGAGVANDIQWAPLHLYKMETMGSPTAVSHPTGGISDALPWDLWTDGDTLYVLWSYTSGADTVVSVVSTTDLTTWTEAFSFVPADVGGTDNYDQTFARSFEYLDGVWYFGLGSNTGTQPDNVGDILAYNTDPRGAVMAVTFTLYNKFKENQFDGGAVIDFDTDTIKLALCTSSYTPNYDTHDFFDDVTNEVAGTGYTAGGATVGSVTVTLDTANDRVDIDGADVSWATSTITAAKGVLYKDTGNAATSPLIGCIDFDGNQTTSATTFTVAWHASGILRVA